MIAGEAASVEDAGKRAAERGAKRVIPLKVSAPFHCSLMMPAADQIRADLDSIQFSDASPPGRSPMLKPSPIRIARSNG